MDIIGFLLYIVVNIFKILLAMNKGSKPYQWVATLYFFQSLPFVVVSIIATLLYQQYGMDNARSLFLTSLITLPWAVKPFFAPILEQFASKRQMTILTQGLVSALFLLLGLLLEKPWFIAFSVLAFTCLALFSSVHDIVTDGLYIQNLDGAKQKRYIPLRTFFYQLGRFLTKGTLLVLGVRLATYTNFDPWQIFFFCLFVITLILAIYHYYQLPDTKQEKNDPRTNYSSILKHLFSDRRVLLSPALFLFFYNMTDAQMQKIIPLYLLDHEGCNLNLREVGTLFGVIGTFALMTGIFIAGYLLNHWSLNKCMKWLTMGLLIGPIMLIILQDGHSFLLYTAIILTQITAGMANAAYMAYMLSLANKSNYPMSTYTFFTAVMALSYVFFTMISGFLEHSLGYFYFFIYLLLTSILVLLMTMRRVQNDAECIGTI